MKIELGDTSVAGLQLVLTLLVIGLIVWWFCSSKRDEHFGADDQNYALAALEDLDNNLLLNGRIRGGLGVLPGPISPESLQNASLVSGDDVFTDGIGEKSSRLADNKILSENYVPALSRRRDFEEKEFYEVQEVSPKFIEENAHKIYLVKSPQKEKDDSMEQMTFFHPVNSQYWPQYYYGQPYQYKFGGAWPPNMFSRLYNWQPGFQTSGWSYWLRPGITYDRWPRGRWVKQNGTFYFVNNGSEHDRMNDYTGQPS